MTITADNLKAACKELGLPEDAHTFRRLSRAFDLLFSGKVRHVEDHSFIVQSQRIEGQSYHVQLKESPYLPAGVYSLCTCQDWQNYSGDQEWIDVHFFCKHSLAAILWLRSGGGGKNNGSQALSSETLLGLPKMQDMENCKT